ncbi:MAG: hypothetical protein QM802_12240 [Agriterribacter sp.]
MNLKVLLLIVVFAFSCTNASTSINNNLNIEIVRHSSDLLHCEKIFADDLQSIEELNEVLLQTGTVDTTDEHAPIRTAIITVDKKEILLTFEKSHSIQRETIEVYKGSGYILTLTYEADSNNFGALIYHGKMVVENNGNQRTFIIEGKNCTL